MISVAVIVPLYNKRPYVQRCLSSILAQTHHDFELIVVDDGSTDGGDELVAACRDSRLRLVRQSNAGPGAARNYGMRLTTAELAAFLDADDEWDPNFLATALDHFRISTQPLLAVNFGMRILPDGFTTEARWQKSRVPNGYLRINQTTPVHTIVALLANMLPSSCVLRRDTALALGGFYDKDRCLFSEDAHLYLKILFHGNILLDPRPLTLRHEDASELALNRSGVRQVEPFLRDPDDIFFHCPSHLRPLAEDVLAARALKTASVYGYYGILEQSRQLFTRFVQPARHWRLPYFAAALISQTPLAGLAGGLIRLLVKLRSQGL